MTEAERCFHCGLPVTTPVVGTIAGQERRFCCVGCRSVCAAIYDAGLAEFYRRAPATSFGPPPPPPRQLAAFDLDEVQRECGVVLGDTRTVDLLVEGIHCAACVWLIENAMSTLPGVTAARVNLTGRRLRLCWDNTRLRLSQVVQRLAELGYAAQPFAPAAAEAALRRQQRGLLLRLAVAGFAAMNLMWISIALYTGAERGEFRPLLQWMGLLLATPTLFYSGAPFFYGAWQGLRHGRASMDLPIALGATIVYLTSLHATLTGASHAYWDTLVNFLGAILFGRYLETHARHAALAATQRFSTVQPRAATRLDATGATWVPIRALRPGERLLVRPGETIPVDGIVDEGVSEVDEALLTGESQPVPRGPGQRVLAGSINGTGTLTITVTAVLEHSLLGQIARWVEEARASRAPLQTLADRWVPYFVTVTLSLAALTWVWWLPRDPQAALLHATAVLIVTCPCALGLATPMAMAVALGQAARNGLLFKHGTALERLARVEVLLCDKTGTLTEGQPALVELVTAEGHWHAEHGSAALTTEQRTLLIAAAALERHVEHPLARALTRFVYEMDGNAAAPPVSAVEIHPGRGVCGTVGGARLVLGHGGWLGELGIAPAAALDRLVPAAGDTVISVAQAGREVMRLRFRDRLRAEAPAAVAALRARGINIALVTGDRAASAAPIGEALGGLEVIAEALPQDKARIVAERQAAGWRVAMIGDGVNDAPALARADVGIAFGSGTDLTGASADLVLSRAQLAALPAAFDWARITLRIVKQNLALAVVYNLIMVPLAVAGWIVPLVAAIAMPLSSLAVIGNAARLNVITTPRALV